MLSGLVSYCRIKNGGHPWLRCKMEQQTMQFILSFERITSGQCDAVTKRAFEIIRCCTSLVIELIPLEVKQMKVVSRMKMFCKNILYHD